MKTNFPIEEGSLEFFEDRIEIRDKWKSARFSYKIRYFSMLYPLILVLRPQHDEMWWIGIGLLSLMTIVLLYRILNRKKEIFDSFLLINQIEKVVLEKYSYDRLEAIFILRNGNYRMVNLDVDRFWQADLTESLEAKNISVQSV